MMVWPASLTYLDFVTFCCFDRVKQWRMSQLISSVMHPLHYSHQYTWAAGHSTNAATCSLISSTTLEKYPVVIPFVPMSKQIQTFFPFSSIMLKISFIDVLVGDCAFPSALGKSLSSKIVSTLIMPLIVAAPILSCNDPFVLTIWVYLVLIERPHPRPQAPPNRSVG
jgi:hypothetical protein